MEFSDDRRAEQPAEQPLIQSATGSDSIKGNFTPDSSHFQAKAANCNYHNMSCENFQIHHQDLGQLDSLDNNNNDSVYNECTIPDPPPRKITSAGASGPSFPFTRSPIAVACLDSLVGSRSNTWSPFKRTGQGEDEANFLRANQLASSSSGAMDAETGATTVNGLDNYSCSEMENLCPQQQQQQQPLQEADEDHDDPSNERKVLHMGLASRHKTSSLHEDVLQNVNNLRLNVNSHFKNGSKNVMGRMRKLSIGESSKHHRTIANSIQSGSRGYKFAFYLTISAISLLFLYLIYRNIFND